MDADKAGEVIKRLGAGAAVLYGVGFVIVRARLNTLGVWSALPVLDAHYLNEGVVYLVANLQHLVRYVLFATPLSAVIWAVWKQSWPSRAEKYREVSLLALRNHQSSLQLVALVVVVFSDGYLTLPAFQTAEFEPSVGRELADLVDYDWVIGWFFATVGVTLWLWLSKAIPVAFTWLAGSMMILMLTVLVPVNFAIAKRSAFRPKADVETKGKRYDCVTLLEDSGEITVFRERSGALIVLPRSAVRSLRFIDETDHEQRGRGSCRASATADPVHEPEHMCCAAPRWFDRDSNDLVRTGAVSWCELANAKRATVDSARVGVAP